MEQKKTKKNEFAVTRLDSCEYNYKWTITNFVFWSNQELTSPSFKIDPPGLFFNIKFCYTDKTLTLKLNLETYLPPNLEDKSINVTFSLVNDYRIVFTETQKFFLRNKTRSYDIPMANDEQLIQAKPILFADKIMKIDCNISIHPGNMTSLDAYDGNVMPESFFAEQLSNSMKYYVRSPTFSDVILISNTEKFPAHKIILSAQSPVFRAMFRSNTIENKRNEVRIDDIKPKVLLEMLRFMYTGKVEKMSEIEDDLLCAADKYNIVGLKLMCSKALMRSTTTENVIDILILADQQDAKLVKTHALNFIARNVKELIEMEPFHEIMEKCPDLRKDILLAMA